MPGEAEDLVAQRDEPADRRVVRIEAHRAKAGGVADPVAPPVDVLGESIDAVERQAERLADLPHRAPPPVGDDLRHERRPVTPVLAVDVLDDLLAPLVLEVDVDVGRLVALPADEPLEEQVDAIGIDRGHPQAIADGGIRRGTAALAENLPRSGKGHQVVHGQEVGRVAQLVDQAKLVLDLRPHLGRHAVGVTLFGAAPGEIDQVLHRGPARRADLVGVLVAHLVEAEGRGPLGDLDAAGDRLRVRPEQTGHLLGRLGRALRVRVQMHPRLLERAAQTDARQHVLERPALRNVVVHVVGGHQGNAHVRPQRRQLLQAACIVGPVETGRSEREAIVVKDPPEPEQQIDEGLVQDGRPNDDPQQPVAVLDQIVQDQMAFPLRRPALAEGQQPAQPPIGRKIRGINKHREARRVGDGTAA